MRTNFMDPGLQIYGDAWTWWEQAEGRYARGTRPEVGAVIVTKIEKKSAKTRRVVLGFAD